MPIVFDGLQHIARHTASYYFVHDLDEWLALAVVPLNVKRVVARVDVAPSRDG
jgi:hypothetical protein